MIEFSGYLTGQAKSFFWKRSKITAIKIFCFPLLILLPLFVIVSSYLDMWTILYGYIAVCLSIPLLFMIPNSKKQIASLTPNHIFTDNEYIVCQYEAGEVCNLISDASKIVDYGDFYYISFPFGHKTDAFVCQKSLITQGTLEEFEALFEGKIIIN